MIEFESVTFRHPNGVVALDDINLRIEDGETVAIVGENGAGKTTLVKHINGLLKPSSGIVKVFDINTKKASVAELSRRVGIVFQNPDHQLFAETVTDEISFALKNFGLSEHAVLKRVEWALGFFGLERYRSVSPMLLSGGEKKRLCLASVLAWDPDVLILDEPTVGQDFAQKERLEQIVRMLVSQGKTVIIVSHDIEFIWPLQPRAVVMSKGRILTDEAASKVFSDDAIVSEANLVRPQLFELSNRLVAENRPVFANVYEARQWILERAGGC